jgi:hypothetical protein
MTGFFDLQEAAGKNSEAIFPCCLLPPTKECCHSERILQCRMSEESHKRFRISLLIIIILQ